MCRFAMLVLSLSMVLGLTGIHCLYAQDKKVEPKKEAPEGRGPEGRGRQEGRAEGRRAAAADPAGGAEKIDAAWHAIAEAVVAAEDAGLVKTSIKPAPVLDILSPATPPTRPP